MSKYYLERRYTPNKDICEFYNKRDIIEQDIEQDQYYNFIKDKLDKNISLLEAKDMWNKRLNNEVLNKMVIEQVINRNRS